MRSWEFEPGPTFFGGRADSQDRMIAKENEETVKRLSSGNRSWSIERIAADCISA